MDHDKGFPFQGFGSQTDGNQWKLFFWWLCKFLLQERGGEDCWQHEVLIKRLRRPRQTWSKRIDIGHRPQRCTEAASGLCPHLRQNRSQFLPMQVAGFQNHILLHKDGLGAKRLVFLKLRVLWPVYVLRIALMGLAVSTSGSEVYKCAYQFGHVLTSERFACLNLGQVGEESRDTAGTESPASSISKLV